MPIEDHSVISHALLLDVFYKYIFLTSYKGGWGHLSQSIECRWLINPVKAQFTADMPTGIIVQGENDRGRVKS